MMWGLLDAFYDIYFKIYDLFIDEDIYMQIFVTEYPVFEV